LFLLFSNLLAYQPDRKTQPTEVGISDQPRLLAARRRKGSGALGGTQGAKIVFLINTFVAHVLLGKCDASASRLRFYRSCVLCGAPQKTKVKYLHKVYF